GINVKRIRIIVFMISSAMAALGGVIFAAQITSVDLSAGGGTILLDAISAAVIGGTSLFGGRGEIKNDLLGAALISAIANGIVTRHRLVRLSCSTMPYRIRLTHSRRPPRRATPSTFPATSRWQPPRAMRTACGARRSAPESCT